MDRLTGADRWRMAARTLLLQASFNYERQQGLGWAWALEPALQRLYPDPAERRERLAEHTAYFNTQPTFASLALGAVARLEEQRAAGAGPDAAGMARIKGVLGSSLAALGDRLYWFTLRPFVACLGVLLVLGGSWTGALALWLCYNVLHLGVRFLGVGWGYRAGTAVLDPRTRRRFERLTDFIAVLGAVIAGVATAWLLAPAGQPRPMVFEAILAAGLALGFVVGLKPRPSLAEWALGAGVLCVAAAWLR
jgi:mannose/fructose/N-acetylgalactosamine-specific phosphotransferase system component IID